MMKNLNLKFLPVLLVILVFGLALSSCDNPVIPGFSSNNDVISYKDFYLTADNVSLETFIRGTIYIRGDIKKPAERHVQISAWVEIDSNDWGGVGFGILQGWEVTGITSDYPQGNLKPETYTTTWQTAADKPFETFIYIGATKYGAPELQGGKGSIIIELTPESSKKKLPEIFQILIGVGSQYDYIMNPIHETFELPLNTDYHNLSSYNIFPWPGNYLSDGELEKSGVALKDARTETAAADANYIIPSHHDIVVKQGEPYLIITGHIQNMDKARFELALWAEGYDEAGKQVSWMVDDAHIAGQNGLHLEYEETSEFTLHINLPDNLKTIRIFAANHLVTPPMMLGQDKVKIPEGHPIIHEQARYLMQGANNELYIYDDGSIIYIKEKGLRMASAEYPATRTWSTGKLTTEQLDSLLDYLNNSGLDKLDDYYNFPGKPTEGGGMTRSDLDFTITVVSGNFSKSVTSSGYLTPDQGETYPGMPSPLNEIYDRLHKIALTTGEVYRENIHR